MCSLPLVALLFVVNYVVLNESARILAVFPSVSFSHQVVFRPYTQELAKRGHELVILTPYPAFPKGEAPPNITEIDISGIRDVKTDFLKSTSGSSQLTQLKVLYEVLCVSFCEQMKLDVVQELLRDKTKHFDLLVVEAIVRSTLALTHIYKVPVIQISSLGSTTDSLRTIGAPFHPTIYPQGTDRRVHNLTLFEKIYKLLAFVMVIKVNNDVEYEFENVMIKHVFGPDIPPLKELKNNIDMYFVNSNPIWELGRPTPPGMIYIGGIHKMQKKGLPQDLKNFIESSEKGFIYFSLGTNVKLSLLGNEKVKLFTNVFSRLPYRVVWSYDANELPGKSENIKVSKWLPQIDLLMHPKIKLFITQGGSQSTEEAINAGVPMISIPMLGDQWYNSENIVHFKVGLQLDMTTLTEESLMEAINTVIENDSYRQNVNRLRKTIADQPMTSTERAIWWTEYVLRHGGAKHLRSPAANISWNEYLETDVLLALLGAIIFTVALILGILYYIVLIMKNILNRKCTRKIKNN